MVRLKALLQDKRANIFFYRSFSRVYDAVNPFFYNSEMRRILAGMLGAN